MPVVPIEKVKSARKQWFQTSYACLPNGNWNSASQDICILDNGEVWVYMVRISSMFSSYIWEGVQIGGEVELTWIGKVSPEGCEQVSGDEFTYGPTLDSYQDAWGYWVPRDEDFYLPHTGWGFSAANSQMITDGTFIYIYWNWSSNGSGSRTNAWYKLDPNTYEFEKIAGSYFPDGGDSPVDSPVGLYATFGDVGQALVHGGWIYFPDIPVRFGSSQELTSIRRMGLTPPYPVETVWDGGSPAGYPGTGDPLALIRWWNAINPATGLPNNLNDDVFTHSGSSVARYAGMAIWEDYIYVLSSLAAGFVETPFESFQRIQAIKRIPIEGGSFETLFYGLGYGGYRATAEFRDDINDSLEFPTGIPHDFLANHRVWSFVGVPELEGWDPDLSGIEVSPNGTLFMPNDCGANFQSGFNAWGVRIIKFDLPTLIAHYEAEGPWRVDRANPQWDTISGGTAFDESALDGRQLPANRNRIWLTRMGGTPLLSHQIMPGATMNNVHPDWVGKYVFIQPSITDSVFPLDLSPDSTNNAMIICVLSEGVTDLQANLYFDGIALKSYAAGPGLVRAYAPEEVVLT